MSRPLIILNPKAGSAAKGTISVDQLRRVVETALGEVDWALTERPRHATEIAEKAARDGRETVVATGGDGSIHEVVNGPATYPKVPNLTDRELHVFALKGAGLGTSRIAQELGISPKTVETYHEHIKLKLGYRDADALHRGAREWFELNHR